jgi:hypothetical protein
MDPHANESLPQDTALDDLCNRHGLQMVDLVIGILGGDRRGHHDAEWLSHTDGSHGRMQNEFGSFGGSDCEIDNYGREIEYHRGEVDEIRDTSSNAALTQMNCAGPLLHDSVVTSTW